MFKKKHKQTFLNRLIVIFIIESFGSPAHSKKKIRMRKSSWANIPVALSNGCSLGFIWYYKDSLSSRSIELIIIMALASILMHLSERKHKLSGIWPFNLWSNFWLNVDRMAAIYSATYVIPYIYDAFMIGDYSPLFIGVSGLWFLYLSENHFIYNTSWFIGTHSTWHIIAFYLFCNALRKLSLD